MSKEQAHWDSVYEKLPAGGGSWARKSVKESINAIQRVAPRVPCVMIDIGGAGSDIGDYVAYDDGHCYILDISSAALGIRDERRNEWQTIYGVSTSLCAGDVLSAPLPMVELWHDRATMHFLTNPKDRRKYVQRAAEQIVPGGGIVVSGFSTEGPTHCSGLEVLRRSPDELAEEFAEFFDRIDSYESDHITPSGAVQRFAWYLGKRKS